MLSKRISLEIQRGYSYCYIFCRYLSIPLDLSQVKNLVRPVKLASLEASSYGSFPLQTDESPFMIQSFLSLEFVIFFIVIVY